MPDRYSITRTNSEIVEILSQINNLQEQCKVMLAYLQGAKIQFRPRVQESILSLVKTQIVIGSSLFMKLLNKEFLIKGINL